MTPTLSARYPVGTFVQVLTDNASSTPLRAGEIAEVTFVHDGFLGWLRVKPLDPSTPSNSGNGWALMPDDVRLVPADEIGEAPLKVGDFVEVVDAPSATSRLNSLVAPIKVVSVARGAAHVSVEDARGTLARGYYARRFRKVAAPAAPAPDALKVGDKVKVVSRDSRGTLTALAMPLTVTRSGRDTVDVIDALGVQSAGWFASRFEKVAAPAPHSLAALSAVVERVAAEVAAAGEVLPASGSAVIVYGDQEGIFLGVDPDGDRAVAVKGKGGFWTLRFPRFSQITAAPVKAPEPTWPPRVGDEVEVVNYSSWWDGRAIVVSTGPLNGMGDDRRFYSVKAKTGRMAGQVGGFPIEYLRPIG